MNRLLDTVYESLDYQTGDLIDVASYASTLNADDYIAKGQWLDTCRSINKRGKFLVDKLFFVQDNPIVVFVDATSIEKEEIFSVYNEVWSLARPRLVFIENETSIAIYDLAANPAKSNKDLNPLTSIVEESKQILKKLKAFNRAGIESGTVFGDKRFSSVNRRADHSLINDLKLARKNLYESGLNGENLKYAHALIGRSIFIRYLEDRGVLTLDYFLQVAEGNEKWEDIIKTPLTIHFYREEMRDLIYPRILVDKELTYRLFKQIALDFNGDTFSLDIDEERVVEQSHLHLLQDFLLGQDSSSQLTLFLWAYRFDVIPIDLISSIYEEFYHSENLIDKKTKKLKDGKGTHYTPSSLVEFVLSRTLTLEVLKTKPRVLDPACGSGIFLVESFRRMVRYELSAKGKETLSLNELLTILRNQIAGIEINSEAIKIAAFSLYLSMLHYLNPPNILDYIKSGGKLPYLIWHGQKQDNHFNILLKANSFNNQRTSEVFETNSFDVVIGNPPWGSPGISDIEGREALKLITKWCDERKFEFPDKEPSQAFLFRGLDFLKPKGICSLLVSSGVLLKFSAPSNAFKQQLIDNSSFKEVINFSHIRRVFFSGAISPFLLIKLEKSKMHQNSSINYIAIRRTNSIEKNKIALLNAGDFKSIQSSSTNVNDIWKIFYWGNKYDFNLISSIRRFSKLKNYVDLDSCAQGFQEANKSRPAEWLTEYSEIPVKSFWSKYDSIDLMDRDYRNKLTPTPDKVKVRGKKSLFEGIRILIRRGIVQKNVSPKGQIIARIESDRFAFRHSLICIKMLLECEHSHKTVIGVMWSSLFRYYMFMTASTWGTWRQEIHLNEVLAFPLAVPQDKQKGRIEKIVQELQDSNKKIIRHLKLSNPLISESEIQLAVNESPEIKTLELELDKAVFDLYQLTQFERQLIDDRCRFDIDLFYNQEKGLANQPTDKSSITKYIKSFKDYWSKNLESDEYFSHNIIYSNDKSMLGVAFHLCSEDSSVNDNDETTLDGYEELLNTELSRNIYTDGLLRRVSDETIFIVKRNLKGHWTQTEASTDAEATFLKAIS